MIDSIIIIIYAIVVRVLINACKSKFWLGQVLIYLGGGLPIILIVLDVLKNDGVTIILAGVCFFWFPMISINNKRKEQK